MLYYNTSITDLYYISKTTKTIIIVENNLRKARIIS